MPRRFYHLALRSRQVNLSRRPRQNEPVVHSSSAIRPAILTMRIAIAAASLGTISSAYAATASSANVTASSANALHFYNVPAGPLPTALTTFSSNAGIYLAGATDLARGKRSPGIKGDFSIDGALSALLAGTGLKASPAGEGQYVLTEAPTTTAEQASLPAVVVNGEAVSQNAGLNPPTSVGSKTPLAQREIPQSLTVVPQEQIQQQNMKTLSDAMRYTPGVSVAQDDSERTSFYSRGFPIQTWMLDGLPTTQSLVTAAPNLAMFDRVEVLQGPDGLMSGFGSEGGTVNLVRKRAPDTFSMNAELFGGTYNDFGGTVDVGGPINQAGTLRGRVVGNIQNQDLMWDSSWRHDKLLYGTLEADLSRDTQLRIGASFNEIDQKANWTGIDAYSTPVDGKYQLYGSRSQYVGTPWNDNTYYSRTAFAELEQKLGSGWTGKLAFNYLANSDSVLNESALGGVENDTNLLSVQADKYHQWDNQQTVDAFVNGPIHLFGQTHTLTFGASYMHENFGTTNYRCGANDSPDGDAFCSTTMTLSELQSAPEPAFNGPIFAYTTATNQFGLYGQGRFKLADPLTLIVGTRITWWNTISKGAFTGTSHISGKVTPYAALVYDFAKNYSAYVSYTSIYQPQSATDVNGQVLKPVNGVQYEAGIKGEYLDGKLNTSAALFQMTEENRPISDPRYPDEGFYLATGRARSRGVELTATGHLTDRWTVFGGYTYTDADYLDGSSLPSFENNVGTVGFSSIAPKHLFKLWTSYQLPGKYQRFTIGGGANISSGIWATDGAGNYLTQGGYATFDMRIGYQISKQLSAAVNVTNLFDRRYIASLELPTAGFYGNPRQILFTLRMSM